MGTVSYFLKLNLENKLSEKNYAEGITVLHQKPQKYYRSNMYFSCPFNRHMTLGSKQDHTKIPGHSQVYAKTELINGMRQVTTSECPYS